MGCHDLKPRPLPAPVSNPPAPKPISDSTPTPSPKPKPPLPASEKCHVTFVFTPGEYSRWETMLGEGGGRSKEDLLLDGMARLNEGGKAANMGGPEHLIVIHECPTCGNATLNNSRGNFKVDKPFLEAARCDAIIQREHGHRRSVIPPRLRRQVLARDQHRCQHPGCRHTRFLQIHHRVPWAQGGRTELDNLITLCSGCHRRLHTDETELRLKGKDPVQ